MSVKLTVRNKDKLFASLKRTAPAIDAELRAALAQSGDEMVDKARSLAPEDDGDLIRSIGWGFTRNTQSNASRSPAIVVTAGGERGTASVFQKFRLFFGMGGKQPSNEGAFYARFVEFGTPDAPKQPFFFPAYRMLRSKLRGRLSRAVGKAIKKAGFK